MPGGQKEAYELVAPILKQLHVAILDAVMNHFHIMACAISTDIGHTRLTVFSLIAEAYALLKGGLALSNEELAQTFTEWNEGELSHKLQQSAACRHTRCRYEPFSHNGLRHQHRYRSHTVWLFPTKSWRKLSLNGTKAS
jgi:hypothetical protein